VDMEEYLSISGIQHFCFCPRQWALIHLEQQWSENIRTTAPLPELMDRKKRDIMERKGDKEDENKRQKQQKESSAAAL